MRLQAHATWGVAEQENPHQYHDGLKSRGGGKSGGQGRGKRDEGSKTRGNEGEEEEKERERKRDKRRRKEKRRDLESPPGRSEEERHTAQRSQVFSRVRDWNFQRAETNKPPFFNIFFLSSLFIFNDFYLYFLTY